METSKLACPANRRSPRQRLRMHTADGSCRTRGDLQVTRFAFSALVHREARAALTNLGSSFRDALYHLDLKHNHVSSASIGERRRGIESIHWPISAVTLQAKLVRTAPWQPPGGNAAVNWEEGRPHIRISRPVLLLDVGGC